MSSQPNEQQPVTALQRTTDISQAAEEVVANLRAMAAEAPKKGTSLTAREERVKADERQGAAVRALVAQPLQVQTAAVALMGRQELKGLLITPDGNVNTDLLEASPAAALAAVVGVSRPLVTGGEADLEAIADFGEALDTGVSDDAVRAMLDSIVENEGSLDMLFTMLGLDKVDGKKLAREAGHSSAVMPNEEDDIEEGEEPMVPGRAMASFNPEALPEMSEAARRVMGILYTHYTEIYEKLLAMIMDPDRGEIAYHQLVVDENRMPDRVSVSDVRAAEGVEAAAETNMQAAEALGLQPAGRDETARALQIQAREWEVRLAQEGLPGELTSVQEELEGPAEPAQEFHEGLPVEGGAEEGDDEGDDEDMDDEEDMEGEEDFETDEESPAPAPAPAKKGEDDDGAEYM